MTEGQHFLCSFCGSPLPRHGRSELYCTTACKRRAASRRAKGRKPLVPPPPPDLCESCGKVACATEEAAKDAKRAVEAKSGRTNAVRYYRCDDGWWHWTRVDATLRGWQARR